MEPDQPRMTRRESLAAMGLGLTTLGQARRPAAPSSSAPIGLVRRGRDVDVVSRAAMVRVAFDAALGAYRLSVLVRGEAGWEPLLDGGLPLLTGAGLDMAATQCAVEEDSDARKVVRLTGEPPASAQRCQVLIRADRTTPLIRLTVTAHLPSRLPLRAPLPHIALWRTAATGEVTLDQGPDSIYRDAGGGVPFGFGFPAAYCWRKGVEAAVFVDMTATNWMTADGVCRFNDCRVMNVARDGQAGLGLVVRSHSGPELPAGEMVTDLYLYADRRPSRPSRLDALQTMVRAFAPLCPAEVAPRGAGRPLTWSHVAASVLRDLTLPGVTQFRIPAGWHDGPVELAPRVETMLIHPDRPAVGKSAEQVGWDFSTVNNHLTPWLLYAQLREDKGLADAARMKVDALPCFYDPKAGLIRYGTRVPLHVGDLDMAWQNLWFHIETARAADACPGSWFNPAVMGRFLMGCASWRGLASGQDYLLPQWYDPYAKQPARQNDVPRLGVVREPWQLGGYAYAMLQAFDTTGERAWLDEAARGMSRLFERPAYSVENDAYRATYRETADIPVTELFGNAFGAVAAHRLHELTKEKRYADWSEGFLATLLRLTFWYEDRIDEVARALDRLGLFLPHAGAASATPWESVEAHLAIAWLIGRDAVPALTPLLLKLSNCYRRSSLLFHPPAFPPAVRALDPSLASSPTSFLPIEPFYSLEARGGHRGPQAAYMGNLALWNWWMFEALATADDPRILVLNTDTLGGYDRVLGSVARRLVVFNTTPAARTVRVSLPGLLPAPYAVRIEPGSGAPTTRTVRGEALAGGLALTIGPREHVRLRVEHRDAATMGRALDTARAARNAIACAYAAVQAMGEPADAGKTQEAFASAMNDYRAGRHSAAQARAKELARQVLRR